MHDALAAPVQASVDVKSVQARLTYAWPLIQPESSV